MPAIQIGKYTRPGIYIQEFDNSVITSPTIQSINTMVIGFSKVGPFNTPVLLQNVNDLSSTFGNFDRTLERKGSFFHRTITQMLLSGPVYGMNLLLTDDTLDLVQYDSLSCASNFDNYSNTTGAAYRKFFDTTGFWREDTDSFNHLASLDLNSNQRVLNLTNLSSQEITVFVYKTKATGFDNNIVNYYGSIDALPPYVNSTDYASDYMVDVIVVSGDWSNYQSLSIDPIWKAYFDNTGLIKTQVQNFINNRNVTLLASYSPLSLLPYFRDLNNNNLFIETIINQDTSTTGLFCAFNMDLFETDYYNGLVDLIGNNLAKNNDGTISEISDINFLSYKDTIVESVSFSNTILDTPGNVFGIDGYTGSSFRQSTYGGTTRTGYYSEGYVSGVLSNLSSPSIATSTSPVLLPGVTPASMAATITNITYSDTGTSSFTRLTATGSFGGYIGGGSYVDNDAYQINLPFPIEFLGVTYSSVYVGSNSYLTFTAPENTTTEPSISNIAILASDCSIQNIYYGTMSASTFKIRYEGYAVNTGDPSFPLVWDAVFYSGSNEVDIQVISATAYGPQSYASGVFDGVSQIASLNPTASNYAVSIETNAIYNPSFDVSYTVEPTLVGIDTVNAYAIINGIELTVSTASTSFTITASDYPKDGTYSSTFAIDTTGTIIHYPNTVNANNVSVPTTSIVLGYLNFNIAGGNINTITSYDITVDSTGYNELIFGTNSNTSDYNVTVDGSGNATFVFWNTAAVPNVSNYDQYRLIKAFNYLVSILDSSNIIFSTFVKDLGTMEKASLANMTISNVVAASTTQDRSFVLHTGLAQGDLDNSLAQGGVLFYKLDNEFILGSNTLSSKTLPATDSDGVVAEYSDFYQKYYEGIINTGDFFYPNLLSSTASVYFTNSVGVSYIVVEDYYLSFEQGDLFQIPTSILNTGIFTIASSHNYTNIGGNSNYTYALVQSTAVDETLNDISVIYNCNEDAKVYLQMYFDGTNELRVEFTASDLQTANPINVGENGIINVQSDDSNYKETVEIESVVSPNVILVNAARYINIQVGDFLEAYVDYSALVVGEVPKNITRILSKKISATDSTLVQITCDSKIAYETYNSYLQTTRYQGIENYVSTYKAIVLDGFTVRQASMPDGTDTQQNAILNLIAAGTPLANALTNKDAISFRYLIDSFGLGLTENSKQQLVDICGTRLDCFGFINMPSMKQFRNSSSPSFVDTNGVLQTSFIAAGGNPESSPAFLYTFASGAGTTCVGYFCPYVTVSDNGRPLDVPPAMFVATTYMRKQNSNVTSITPWTIAAGVTNGKTTGFASVESSGIFNPDDISNLNGASINPIVIHKNRGYVIETENTAQTLYKSSLSYIHVREVLIELEGQLAAMLLDFQWKFNTPDVRAEIKLRADVICETFVNQNGLYNYFNKCDDENNTPTIIDNQIGVLDTYVEPIKGMGIIVNNVTILSTGAIQSGGFITAS